MYCNILKPKSKIAEFGSFKLPNHDTHGDMYSTNKINEEDEECSLSEDPISPPENLNQNLVG